MTDKVFYSTCMYILKILEKHMKLTIMKDREESMIDM